MLVPSYRKRIRDGLLIAFGDELDEAGRGALARENMRHWGMSLFEFLRLERMSTDELAAMVDIEGEEILERYARGPAIFLSAHLGNFEALACALVARGFPFTVVIRHLGDPWLHRRVIEHRLELGMGVIDRREGHVGARCLRVLRGGGVLALAADQDAGPRGLFVPFFGREASSFAGPARLARKLSVPLIPMFCTRGPDDRLLARIEEPLELSHTGDGEADDRRNTARYLALLETYIRDSPASYLWLHRRWKTRREPSGQEGPA